MRCGIIWLGQAGYLLDFEGLCVCVDPYLSDSVEEAEGMKRMIPAPVQPETLPADYLLFTHDHLDHFDGVSIRRMAGRPVTMIGPASCIEKLPSCGIRGGILLERGGELVLGNRIVVRGVYAEHTADSIGLLFREKGAQAGGLYLTGDTKYSPVLLQVRKEKPEILIVCINGKLGNMDYKDAARLAQELGVSTAIPCHYGMFAKNTEDPARFRRSLAGSGVHCLELAVGCPEALQF